MLNKFEKIFAWIGNAWELTKLLLIVGLVSVVAFRACSSASNKESSAVATPIHQNIAEDQSQMAYLICQGFLKQQLKSPSSADFPWAPDTSGKEGNSYALHGHVDADNSFGAKLRKSFSCNVQYNGGEPGDIQNWSLLKLTVS